MEIFKLVGSLVIDGAEKAGKAIDGVSETIQGLKRKVEEYKKTGTSTSAAWKKATEEMKENTESSASGIENSFQKIGAAITAFVALDKIKDFGAYCIQIAADAKAMESQFGQVFEGIEISASEALSVIANNTGINENRMKGSFTKIAAFAQTTGMETEASLSLAERAMIAVADSAAFYDRSLEDTTESLQSFLKGNYENDSALGLSCTETTRNTAANNLYGKSFNELSEAQKQLTLLQMVEEANELSGAIGQAARESDTWTNQTGNLKQAWDNFTAMIGEKILPLAVDIVTKLSEIVSWLTEHKTVVTLLAVVIGTLTTALIAYNVAQTLATTGMTLATAAGAAFGSVMAFLTSPITLVVAAIGALIAIIVLCVKHWDDIKEAASKAWEWIKGAWESASTWFDTNVIQPIVGFFKGLWDGIVGIFQSVIDWVKENWESIVLFIINPFAGVFNYLYENFEGFRNFVDGVVSAVKDFFINLWNDISTAFTAAWDGILGFFSTIGDWINTNVIQPIVKFFTGLWESVKQVWDTICNVIQGAWDWIKSTITTAINNVKSTITTVWNAITTATSTAFNAVKNTASNVWNGIKTAISTVVNGVKSTISSVWNGIKSTTSSVFNGVKSTATSVWNGIKSAITTPIEKARDTIKSIVDKIKGFFSGMKISFPSIELPHFTISPSGWKIADLLKGSIPKLGISWYAKAMNNPMLMTEPTIFGYNAKTGQLQGGGEAGSEVVSGTNTLMNMISNAVAAQNDDIVYYLQKLVEMLADYFPQVISASGHDIVTNDGVIVARYAPMLNVELGKISNRKDRGR